MTKTIQPISFERTRELILAAQAGDNGAAETLLKQFRPLVRGIARELVKNTDDAERLEEAIHVGEIGLWEAVMAIDVNKYDKVLLSRYADRLIRNQIVECESLRDRVTGSRTTVSVKNRAVKSGAIAENSEEAQRLKRNSRSSAVAVSADTKSTEGNDECEAWGISVEMLHYLPAAFARLNPQDREAIGRTYGVFDYRKTAAKDLAPELGIPQGTVRSRVFYACQRLRDALAAEIAGDSEKSGAA